MRNLILMWCLAVALGVLAGVPMTHQLPNGLTCVTQTSTASQVVSMTLLVDYAALDEPREYAGLRQVLLHSMLAGSAGQDGNAIRKRLAARGGVLEGRVHADCLEFSVRVPAGEESVGLSALQEIVTRPALTHEGVLAAADAVRARLGTEPVGALDYTNRLTQAYLYGLHPYGAGVDGTASGVGRISTAIVRWAHQSYVQPRAAVLAIVGRPQPETLLPLVREAFGGWAGSRKPLRPEWSAPELPQSMSVLREYPVRSACVMMTFPVPGTTHPDFRTLRVIEGLLAGGTGARLFRSVREERKLAYEVSTQLPAQVATSHFTLYALTGTQYLDETKTAVVDEIIRLQTEPVPEAELRRAKAYLKGRYLLGHQYGSQYAFDLAWYELQGLGVRYDATYLEQLEAVSAEDVQRVACAYFTHYLLAVSIPLSYVPSTAE